MIKQLEFLRLNWPEPEQKLVQAKPNKPVFVSRIEDQHVQFRVEPNPQNLDAETMADVVGECFLVPSPGLGGHADRTSVIPVLSSKFFSVESRFLLPSAEILPNAKQDKLFT